MDVVVCCPYLLGGDLRITASRAQSKFSLLGIADDQVKPPRCGTSVGIVVPLR